MLDRMIGEAPVGKREVAMALQQIDIDRDRLRAVIRKLGNDQIFYLLDRAIDLLSPTKLERLIKGYIAPRPLRRDGENPAGSDLLANVKVFEKASLAGQYYQSFDVNYKNCTQHSRGTVVWIADCHRLLDRCAAQARKGDPVEVRKAFDILFGLLDRIDECPDDVLFFADEGGSDEVGIDWSETLPHWFRVLSATSPPEEYAEQVTAAMRKRCWYNQEKVLGAARRMATPAQRTALAEATGRQLHQGPWSMSPRTHAGRSKRGQAYPGSRRGRGLCPGHTSSPE